MMFWNFKTAAGLGFYAAVACLAFAVPSNGQSRAGGTPSCSVTGTVTDTTKAPLPGVVVALTTTGLSVVTDGEGRYCMPPLRAGDYVLELTLEGFSSFRQPVSVTGTAPIAADAVLSLGGFREETVVTATRTRQGLDRVPVRTEVIRRADIEASSARTLADAVEFTTGVRVESNCQNCNFSQIRLLGLDGPYTQVLFDGQPTFSSLASVYGIEQIPAGLVERIEVVKGGGSALYGAGSVGGVVNIISREPARSALTGEIRMESRQGLPAVQFNGGADWMARDRQTSLTAFMQADTMRAVDVDGDGFTEVARRALVSGGLRVSRYALQGRGKLTVDVTRFNEDRRGGNLLWLPPDQTDIAEAIDTRRTAGSASWYQSVSSAWDYRTTVSIASTYRDSYYGTGRDPNAYGTTDNRLVVGDAQANRYWRKHTLTTGVTVSNERLDDQQPAYDRAVDVSYRNVGAYVQDDWTLGAKTQLVAGVRLDRSSAIDRAIASPRLALRWSPRENLDVRTSFARGFRPPQAFDEDLHLTSVGGEAVIIRQSPDLREEISTNMLAGLEWKPHIFGGQGLVEFNVFSTRLDDLFFNIENPEPVTQSLEFLKVNLGSAHVYGTELNVGWGLGERVIVQGGVVVQRARLGEPEPDFGSRNFFRTPQTYGTASLLWSFGRGTRVFAGTRYTGSMEAPHRAGFIDDDVLERTRRFVTLDLSLGQRLPTGAGRSYEVIVGARNLSNAYQDDLDRGPDRDSDYVYGPRFPRSIYVAFKVGL
jgi:outer membrane receptor for ferrienterochelin and colicins